MDSEKLNVALYEKMYAEQGKFRDWLLTQPAEEILKHAYEYTVREDFLMAMEYLELPGAQAAALLAVPLPLDSLFQKFEKQETDYMNTIRDSIESLASDLQKVQHELPVYYYSAAYAREHNELEQYHTSAKANEACKLAIETAINDHYRDNCLGREAVREVEEQFGYERTLYVLANTVRQKDCDGRISQDNKDWARTVPVVEDVDGLRTNRNLNFVVDAVNPGLIDIFLRQARREYLMTEQPNMENIQNTTKPKRHRGLER